MGLIQSVEGPKRKKDTRHPQGEGNSASRMPSSWSCNMNSCLGLQPASLPADVELGRANSLNSLPHSLSPSSPRHTHTPLSPVKAKPHVKLTITFTYNTIYPFRCTVLRDLTKLELCSPHENLNKVLQVQTTLCSPSFLPPHSLATTDLFSSLVVLPFAQCHINGIIHYVTF